MPTSAPTRTTSAASLSRCVEPTPSLMLMPSGSAPMTVTFAPALRNVSATPPMPRRARSRARRAGRRGDAGARRAGGSHNDPPRRRSAPHGRRRRRSGAASRRPSPPRCAARQVGQLHAAAREDLDPVVGSGIVDAEIMTPKSASMSPMKNAVAGVGRVPASSTSTPEGAAGLDRGGEELPRDAGVARDDGGEPLAGGLARLGDTALAQDAAVAWPGQRRSAARGPFADPPHASVPAP